MLFEEVIGVFTSIAWLCYLGVAVPVGTDLVVGSSGAGGNSCRYQSCTHLWAQYMEKPRVEPRTK